MSGRHLRELGFIPPGFGDAPVGAVMSFAGNLDASGPTSSPPASAIGTTAPIEAYGWMACDGRALETALYPELFAALGYIYGGSGNSFNIPDYRGYFLRGMDGGAAVNPEPNGRTAQPGGTATGVGSMQGFALQDHEHTYLYAPTTAAPASSGDTAGVPSQQTMTTQDGPVNAVGAAAVQVSLYETRPVNIYVTFIIKFTYGLRVVMG